MAANRASRRVIARVIASKLVAEPARQDHWITVLAGYLVENNRITEADLIVNDIEHELYEQDGQLLVNVTSARPLAADVRTSLTALLTDRTKAKKVTITEAIDPNLLGGLVAKTADAELDASVRTKLNRLATIN
jgi:F-type H+-transporting ATPase subunit delta